MIKGPVCRVKRAKLEINFVYLLLGAGPGRCSGLFRGGFLVVAPAAAGNEDDGRLQNVL